MWISRGVWLGWFPAAVRLRTLPTGAFGRCVFLELDFFQVSLTKSLFLDCRLAFLLIQEALCCLGNKERIS